MLFIIRLLMVGLLCVGGTATTAHAGNQMFDGSWIVKAFGNECSLADPSPGPHCGNGASESEFYAATAVPLGIQCNPNQPRCAFSETPTDGNGNFAPLGGSQGQALFCVPWLNWRGNGTSVRPAKGETYQSGTGMKAGAKIPPFYRNRAFFTESGEPGRNLCTGTSTGATPGGKGLVQAGHPAAGRWAVTTTGTQMGGFNFAAAPLGPPAGKSSGLRVTGLVGEFGAIYPYVYSYTYATFRNNVGVFGPGSGPGSFNLIKKQGGSVASINVKQGAAKFGGTMTMLGALTTKVCYYRNGGCSLGTNNWRYDAIGTSAPTKGGVVTNGYIVTYKAYYYHTGLMQLSTVDVEGSRFPWTTGSVTLTATGRGPHKTIHYTHGYDNRNTTTPEGQGTIQMVTPVLTRWLQPALNFETGGVGILRIKFVPEPQTWAMLIAGVSLLGVGYRMRGR
jgi:hypothetical protein